MFITVYFFTLVKTADFLKTNLVAHIPTALLNIEGQTRNVSEILGKDCY